MRMIFAVHDMYEKMTNGVDPLPTNPSDAQKNTHKNAKTNNNNVLFLMHRYIDVKVFEKNVDSKNA